MRITKVFLSVSLFLVVFFVVNKPVLGVTSLICGTAPNLVSPAVGQELTTNKPILDWTDVAGRLSYRVQLSALGDFSKLIVDTNTTSSKYSVINPLPRGVVYYWRVKTNYSGCSSDWIWAKKWKFYIKPITG